LNAPDRLHRLRAEGRAHARGDRRRAGEAAGRPNPHPARLVAALAGLDGAHRRPHCRARAPARGA